MGINSDQGMRSRQDFLRGVKLIGIARRFRSFTGVSSELWVPERKWKLALFYEKKYLF